MGGTLSPRGHVAPRTLPQLSPARGTAACQASGSCPIAELPTLHRESQMPSLSQATLAIFAATHGLVSFLFTIE